MVYPMQDLFGRLYISSLIENRQSVELLSLNDQIRSDLTKFLSKYKTKSAGIRLLERNTSIGRRQILRYVSGESVPHFYNLKKMYSYLLNEYDYSALLKKLPLSLREIFIKNNPAHQTEKKYREDYGEKMTSNPVFFEVYWRTVDDSQITREEIIRKYGDYGLSILNEMRDKNIIRELASGVFSSGMNRSAPLAPTYTKKVSEKLIERFFNVEKSNLEGRNYLTFNIVKLHRKAREEMIRDLMALNQKIIDWEKNIDQDDDPQMVFNVFCMDQLSEKNH